MSQIDFIKAWFRKHPNRDIHHSESRTAIEKEWAKIRKEPFADIDRGTRQLAQEGFLVKVKKGWYRYDPSNITSRKLEDFSSAQKREILARDGYRCVICGLGQNDGVDLQVDHIKPKELGGTAAVTNGQTLCARHNFIKKISSQTETGKKMFITLLSAAKASDDANREKLIDFCEEILSVFEKHGINGHIEWKDK
jgi:predicted restriction endonuclease